MKHELKYTCNIILKDGTKIPFTGHYVDNIFKVPYDEAMASLMKEVKDYLNKKGIKHHKIKELDINLNYSETRAKPEEELFFYELLDKTAEVFKNSDTRKKYPDENWNFAICDTPIQKGNGLFFGLNWGGNNIDQQSVYPPKGKERDWNFVTHSRPFFKQYFDALIEDLNYSNLCFFRSPNMKHFVSSDWDKGIPLFWEYVDFVNPKWALMLGQVPAALKSPLYLSEVKRLEVYDEKNKKYVKGYTGTLFGRYPFGNVPHPQARISSEARHEIWDWVVNKDLKLRTGIS